MTSIVIDVSRQVTAEHNGEMTAVAVVAIVLLIVLAVEQELIRASDGPSATMRARPFNAAIIPLLVAFAVIVGSRFVDLLP